MKKQITESLAAKDADSKAEIPNLIQGSIRKVVYGHKPCDHSYGRVNKHPISLDHGPGLFR